MYAENTGTSDGTAGRLRRRASQTSPTGGVVKPSFAPSFYDGGDGFITKLNSTGSGLVYSTFIGVNGGTDECLALALDSSGQPTVAGMLIASPIRPASSIMRKHNS